MSPAHVLEPTYSAVRRNLLAGAWRAGQRLEAARLADDLGVSITPVRDSLSRLTGERLIDSRMGEGFYVPRLDETELRKLLAWHETLVTMAIDKTVSGVRHNGDHLPSATLSERSGNLFALVARGSQNGEIEWAVSNAGARLGRYRQAEMSLIEDVDAELSELERCFHDSDLAAFLALVRTYHHHRREIASEITHAALMI